MENAQIRETFGDLSTAQIVDALLRAKLPFSIAPHGIRSVSAGAKTAGRARPVRHMGSVDVLLEAIQEADPGDVLVVDNGGRTDVACIGDLIAEEANAKGLAGIVIWGLHRDTRELEEIGLPVFSYGALPIGPEQVGTREPDALERARVGGAIVTREMVVFGDADGVLFAATSPIAGVLEEANGIRERERGQARRVRRGKSLYEQFEYDDYLLERQRDPEYTLTAHLKKVGGVIGG